MIHQEYRTPNKRLAAFVQQHPKGINAERRAERQQNQIDGCGHNGEHAGSRAALPQRQTDEHVACAPQDRDDRQRDERSGGKAGGDLRAAVVRRRKRGRADAECERRDADDGRQGAPHDEQDGDELDVSRHPPTWLWITRVTAEWRCGCSHAPTRYAAR